MSGPELLKEVEAGRMTMDEANEQLKRQTPLQFSTSPRGLVQITGLVETRTQPAYTVKEWRRILARAQDILAGLEKAA